MKTQLMLLASLAFALCSTEAFAAPNETTISGDTAVQLCQAFNAKNGDRGTHWWCDFKCGVHNCHVSCVVDACTLNVSFRSGSSGSILARPTFAPKPPAPPSLTGADGSRANGATLSTTTKGGNNNSVSSGVTGGQTTSSAVSKSAGFSTGKSNGGPKIQ